MKGTEMSEGEGLSYLIDIAKFDQFQRLTNASLNALSLSILLCLAQRSSKSLPLEISLASEDPLLASLRSENFF